MFIKFSFAIKYNYFIFSIIYYLIEEWNHFWKKMIMIQELANDPGRFWQNRGGQLLKEEKERKVIQKVILIYILFVILPIEFNFYYFQIIWFSLFVQELPRVEKELKILLKAYEQREGKSFLYNDEILINFIDEQWNEMKTNKKLLRQNKVFNLNL